MPHTSLAVFKWVVLAQIAIYMSIYYTFIGDFADIRGISVVISIYRHCVRANAAFLFLLYKFKVTKQHIPGDYLNGLFLLKYQYIYIHFLYLWRWFRRFFGDFDGDFGLSSVQYGYCGRQIFIFKVTMQHTSWTLIGMCRLCSIINNICP